MRETAFEVTVRGTSGVVSRLDEPRAVSSLRLQQKRNAPSVHLVVDLDTATLKESDQRLSCGLRIAFSFIDLRPPAIGSLFRDECVRRG